MNAYLRLLNYVKPYRWMLLVAFICMGVGSACTLALPWMIRNLIQKALDANDLTSLNLVILISAIIVVILAVASYGEQFLMNYVAQRIIFTLRNQIFTRLTTLSLKYHISQRTGEMMSRVINDVNILQGFIDSTVVRLIQEPLVLLGGIGFLFYLHWKLALLSLVLGPLIAISITKFGQKMRKVSMRIQEKMADLTALLNEVIRGIQVVKLFGREGYENNRFEQENQRYFKLYLKGTKLQAASTPSIELLGSMGIIIVLWYGGREVIAGHLTTGDLITFALYLLTISMPLRRLSRANMAIQQAAVAGTRIFQIIDLQETLPEVPDAAKIEPLSGKIEFLNTSFGYNGQNVLHQINLEIKPGEVIALVGPSGGGKTSLTELITRMFDPTSGCVMIDGYDLKKLNLESLRRQIAVVPQQTILFSGTVAENIGYGRADASFDDIVEAAKAANAHNFIIKLEDGYNTPIGEDGVKLSGGERQRLAIARAIIRQPAILILDEATSNLDTESEALVQDALSRIMRHQTTIVVAHRLSTVVRADRIAVINKGQIVEIGRHKELLARGELYKILYEGQVME
ncbi:MAG: ABC transporter ATP-binding protein [bacterium]|nr:ABC transporter ATP-binding protein [bacterium]